ncbi:polysaccharide pyruvyl transferase family protein [Ancylobacter terrae]|uniref:polysaccharide pyruvyl transferase family protein n=1 Tax=Ancylobacter sp. sgz301288 TaxID=3342077 RepID=UPI00385E2213
MAPIKAVLANTTTQIGHHGCTLVNRQIEALAAEAGIEIVAHFPARVSAKMLAGVPHEAIIINGEGSVHHDKHEARGIADLAEMARDSGTPAYLINSVYEANTPELGRRIAMFRRVYVRDTTSQKAAIAHGIDAKVVPDLTLSWQHAAQPPGTRGLVVNDSTRGAVRTRLFALAQHLGAPFISMRDEPPILPDYPDKNLQRRAIFAFKRAISLVAPSNQWRGSYRNVIFGFDAFIDWLSANTGLLVTGRFHGLCISLDLEIPVLAVASNTSKVQALLADIGLEGRLLADYDAFAERFKAEGVEGFRFSAEDIERIRAFKVSARERARAMFADIVADIRNG